MSYHIYTTPGFILESRNVGEANKFFSVFTKELGLIGVTAQGVRLQKSKLRSHLNVFSEVVVSLVRGKEVWRLTSATGIRSFKEMQNYSLELSYLYARILLLLKRLLAGEEKNETLFILLGKSFDFARDAGLEGSEQQRFEEVLVVRILHNLGYIGSSKELTPFTESILWSMDILTIMTTVQKSAREAINKAFKESHL
ncbi:MAG TPA: DNA repair protein RecO [Candidatus Paceibacterota bacterium]